MNITKPINRKGKAALTLGAGLVLSCCAVYAANKEVKDKTIITSENSILELRDDDGITYIKENDNFYIEKDGERRAMTEAERAAFERKHEKTMAELKVTEEEIALMEKEIEESMKEFELHADEIERVNTQEIELAVVEVEKAHEAIAKAQREIELQFERGDLSEEEVQRVKASLKRAKKEMLRDRERVKVDIERVKRDAERAKVEIKRQLRERRGSAHNVMIFDEQEFVGSSGKSSHVIKWATDDGKVYVKENGEYRIKENGETRAMTTQEKELFDAKIMFIPKPEIPEKPAEPAKPVKPMTKA